MRELSARICARLSLRRASSASRSETVLSSSTISDGVFRGSLAYVRNQPRQQMKLYMDCSPMSRVFLIVLDGANDVKIIPQGEVFI